MEPKTNKFHLGQVVGCYLNPVPGWTNVKPVYGVVVQLPMRDYPRYRVRVSTESFLKFVEIGVLEQHMQSRL